MNKNLKTVLRIGMPVVLILLVLNLERYIEKLYLQSEINYSFLSQWPIYLTISIIITFIYWKFESKKVNSNILKIVSALIFFGFSFYESNRILLCINSMTQTKIIHQEYKVKLNGVAWGEIGIEDFEQREYNEIKASVKETEGLSENDIVKIEFYVGVFGLKHAPKLIKE